MNKRRAKSLVKEAFSNPKAKLYRGAILIPDKPVEIPAVMKAAAQPDEEEDDFRDRGSCEFFESLGWPLTGLINFYWQSVGPCVFQTNICAVRIGKDAALIVSEADSWIEQAIALVKHPSNPAVMSAFFKAFIHENGAAFGVGIFGSVPSNTYNMAEETIAESVVRSAYWDWLKWADADSDVDWYGMADEILEREQSPVMYPLEILKKFGKGFDGDLAEWLAKRSKENGQLTSRAKRAIFEAYFKQSYGSY